MVSKNSSKVSISWDVNSVYKNSTLSKHTRSYCKKERVVDNCKWMVENCVDVHFSCFMMGESGENYIVVRECISLRHAEPVLSSTSTKQSAEMLTHVLTDVAEKVL